MTSPGYRSSRTGAFRTRSERLSTSGDDVVEGSSATVSVAHGTAFELVSIAVDVGTVVGCSALCDTPLKSVGADVNSSRVVMRCCRLRRMSRPSSLNTSYDRGPLRRITLVRTGHLPRRGSFTRTVSFGCNAVSDFPRSLGGDFAIYVSHRYGRRDRIFLPNSSSDGDFPQS